MEKNMRNLQKFVNEKHNYRERWLSFIALLFPLEALEKIESRPV